MEPASRVPSYLTFTLLLGGDNHITAGTAWRGAIRIGKTKKLEAARAPKEADRTATDSEGDLQDRTLQDWIRALNIEASYK